MRAHQLVRTAPSCCYCVAPNPYQRSSSMSLGEAVEEAPAEHSARHQWRPAVVIVTSLVLLFGVPWWLLTFAGADWPAWVVAATTIVFVGGAVALPFLMVAGHGPRRIDRAAVAGDTMLGVIWVLFTWSLLGNVLRLALALAGVADPVRARIVAAAVLIVSAVIVTWGYAEAMRVPRIKRVEVRLPRLGVGLDGLRIVLITDTHYGPIDRARWSARVVETVNELDADIVCHTGDI